MSWNTQERQSKQCFNEHLIIPLHHIKQIQVILQVHVENFCVVIMAYTVYVTINIQSSFQIKENKPKWSFKSISQIFALSSFNLCYEHQRLTLRFLERCTACFTLSKSEFTHRRKWSDGFRLGGQGKPASAKNYKRPHNATSCYIQQTNIAFPIYRVFLKQTSWAQAAFPK